MKLNKGKMNTVFVSDYTAEIMKRKDYQSPQTETQAASNQALSPLQHSQIWNEIGDMSRSQEQRQTQPLLGANLMLQHLFAMQQNEIPNYQGDLPTSLLSCERALAKYMSECLQDCPSHKCDISYISTLLRDYKVVLPVRGQSPSVSLGKVHLILQDNYKGSSLCSLFDLLLGCTNLAQPKVVIIY